MRPAKSALDELRKAGMKTLKPDIPRVTVGTATCGSAAGSIEIFEYLSDIAGDDYAVVPVGCRGLCSNEPLVEVNYPDGRRFAYANVDLDLARRISEAIHQGNDSALACAFDLSDFLDNQERRALTNCGVVNPGSLAEYVSLGGYEALQKALVQGSPQAIVDRVTDSGLRGRGGAGFSAGTKWQAMRQNEEKTRYFIVNADEGDPGAYMDRGLLESDPHKVLEGLIIGCYATGVNQAYFFIRAEYPLAVQVVSKAIQDAYEYGFLGNNILGSGFDLDVGLVRGAGAFLCGESTAMVNVLEGKPCTTRKKPPHMTEKGLWGKPTCINNVETLANVPLIILNGAQWFRSVGTELSPGTKIFSVTGAVKRAGLIEVPLGTDLEHIVTRIAQASDAKAVQIGGPSGALIPASLHDLEISYEGLNDVGGMMGSGGFVVISKQQCVVDTASYLVRFSSSQSCSHCRQCVRGLGEASEILERITHGQGQDEDLVRLQRIAEETCGDENLCGLGRSGLNPLVTSIHYFKEEYEAHIKKMCPGLVCKDLISYEIIPDKCQGERCCLLTCPGNAIKGPFGKSGRIVERLCQKCGMCMATCCYGAVRIVTPAKQNRTS